MKFCSAIGRGRRIHAKWLRLPCRTGRLRRGDTGGPATRTSHGPAGGPQWTTMLTACVHAPGPALPTLTLTRKLHTVSEGSPSKVVLA